MKFSIQTILILCLGFVAHQFLPFWALALVAFVTGLFFQYKNSGTSFLAGFIGGSLLWGGMAYFANAGNMGILSSQLGELFTVSGATLGWATGALGGIVAGLGAMTGTLAKNIFVSPKSLAS